MERDKTQSESTLINELKRGSQQAFNDIYQLYAKRLYLFALRYASSPEEAEEIVEDTFVKLWDKRSAIRQQTSLAALLFISAKNLLINAYKARANAPLYLMYMEEHDCSSGLPADYNIHYHEFVVHFKAALAHLTPTQQKVIQLSKIEGWKNQKIARKLHLDEHTVRNALSIGLKALREEMQAEE
jgi:RNA polymerase sigma-70 factor (ECF subfamily)